MCYNACTVSHADGRYSCLQLSKLCSKPDSCFSFEVIETLCSCAAPPWLHMLCDSPRGTDGVGSAYM
jgi:hypothetical protein